MLENARKIEIPLRLTAVEKLNYCFKYFHNIFYYYLFLKTKINHFISIFQNIIIYL
jgi:hypothetical protein